MKLFKKNIAISLGVLALSSMAINASAEESCYELNQRYGRCVQATLKGEPCRPGDDFVMPERCRGGRSSDQGLRDGMLNGTSDEDKALDEWIQENRRK